MRELGLLTRPLGDVIVFMPPLISTENDLKEMLSLMKTGIVETVTNI